MSSRFLTAKLCLEELLKSRTPHQIETALTNLPKSHELYQTIFRRLKAKWELPGDRQWAKKILTMVCFSDIPFSPRDLLYIVGLDLDAPRVDHSDILDAPLITDYCDGLITIHVKSEKVALVHVQAKKFFEENQEEYFPDAHYEIAERYIAHVMAQSSVGYIHHHDLFNMSIFAVKNLGSEVRKHLAQTLPRRFSTLRRLTSQSITAMNVTTSADELKSPAMDEQNQRLITKLAAMICDPGCAAIICQVFIEMSPWHSLREDSSNIFNSPSPYWERLGWTRLHIVAAMGLAEVARHFVTNVAPLDTVDLFGKSAVAVAMDRQHPDVAEILVHAGAEVDIFSATGQTVLITAVGRGHLDFARKILTSSEATAPWSKIFTKPRKDSKDLRLLLAALDNDIAIVKKICERSKVADDPMAATALLLSADCGHRDIMKLLLAAAVPVGSHDAEGRTALHRAARRNDKAMAEMLLSHSADVDVTSVFGLTAWSEVVASPEHEDMVKLLVAHATDINVADQDGVSTLYIAAAGGHLGLVSKLLAVGADASIRTRFGWTPLVCCTQSLFSKPMEIRNTNDQ
jgi:ankyrin repeat protein